MAINLEVLLFFNDAAVSHGVLREFARFCSVTLPTLASAVFMLWLGARQPRSLPVFAELAISLLLAWLCVRGIKFFWPQPRPFDLGMAQLLIEHGHSASFPSAHATIAASLVIAAWRLKLPMLACCFLMLATLMISWSRIALGVHFPGDVVAGWLLGGCIAYLASILVRSCLLRPSQPDQMLYQKKTG